MTGLSAQTLYLIVRIAGQAVSNVGNVTLTSNTSGQAYVYPNGQLQLGAGSFTGTVTVIACTTDPNCSSTQLAGSPATIEVTYTIDGLNSSAKNLTYTIGNAPTAADLTRSFNVTGYPVQNFSVQSDVPWLAVTPTTASTSGQTAVTASLVQSQVDGLDSGTYTGHVTMTGTSGDPAIVPVSLIITRTQVNFASPYLQFSSSPGDVIIRGENLDLTPALGVRFGDTYGGTNFQVISATEIHATHPAMPAGSYTVHVLNAQGEDLTHATMTVVDPPVWAAATIAYPPSSGSTYPLGLIYDAGRASILAIVSAPSQGSAATQILRYQASGSTWTAPSVRNFPAAGAFSLSTDGGKLLTAYENTNGNTAVAELDPVSLATLKQTSGTNTDTLRAPTSIAVTNDGLAVLTMYDTGAELLAYPLLRPGIASLALAPGSTVYAAVMDNAIVNASADGSSLVFVSRTTPEIMQWNSSTQQLTDYQAKRSASMVSLSRDGSRVVTTDPQSQNIWVYDANITPLGILPFTTLAAVVSADGSRAYTYDSVAGTVRIFDLTAAPGAGNPYPEITPALTPAANPLSPSGGVPRMV